MPTLLIVEDELVLARNLSKAFVRHGFEVQHATGIAEGRKIGASTPVDVALLERKLTRTRPDYAAYIQRTSAFVPWFPKRRDRQG